VVDREQRGNWRDASTLLALGLAVDLRWFEGAWPAGLQALGKLLLVGVGLYGFLAIRQLSGTGFDLHLRWSDLKTGLCELIFLAPVLLFLGIELDFIHPHASAPGLATAALSWVGIFFFIALPEEFYFRAWVQNLLERRLGSRTALMISLRSSGCRISTSDPCISTGATYCWLRSREFSMGERGEKTGGCRPHRSPTPA